jgi:hypothetical protein
VVHRRHQGVSRRSSDRISQPDPDRGDVDGALVHELALVLARRDGAELLELAEAALDGVARRFFFWSSFTGMTAAMPRRRSQARLAAEEYALSAIARPGRVRGRPLAAARDADLLRNARLLAQMNIALAEATIAVWNAKNTYNFWRPVTAIRAGTDPSWTPLLPTPALQEYPSAHSGVSFYADHTVFTVTSAGLPGVQPDARADGMRVAGSTGRGAAAGRQLRLPTRALELLGERAVR